MTTQPSLFAPPSGQCGNCGGQSTELRPDPRLGRVCQACRSGVGFDGATYNRTLDHERLTGQLRRIYDVMRRGEWLTLGEIAAETGDPPASISAQIRHLRKPRFGSYEVKKRHRGEARRGLFEYLLVLERRG